MGEKNHSRIVETHELFTIQTREGEEGGEE